MSRSSAAAPPAARRRCICAGAAPRSFCSSAASCGGQASGVNYGGVRQQGRNLAELPLARRSREMWGRLAEIVGSDCEFVASGHVKLARSDADMAELEAYREAVRPYGLELELLGRNELRARYPFLGDAAVGGSLCADDGQANPRLVAPAFARAARAAGADIREHAPVTTIEHDGARFRAAHGETVSRSARATLVNVAGAWGHEIAARFGESVPEDVIAPNMCVTEPVPYFMVPNFGVCGGGFYVRQIPRGNVIFGGGRGIADRERLRAYPVAATSLDSSAPDDRAGAAPAPCADHPHLDRHRGRHARRHPGDRSEPDDAGPLPRVRLLGPRFPARPGDGRRALRAHPGRRNADADRPPSISAASPLLRICSRIRRARPAPAIDPPAGRRTSAPSPTPAAPRDA